MCLFGVPVGLMELLQPGGGSEAVVGCGVWTRTQPRAEPRVSAKCGTNKGLSDLIA